MRERGSLGRGGMSCRLKARREPGSSSFSSFPAFSSSLHMVATQAHPPHRLQERRRRYLGLLVPRHLDRAAQPPHSRRCTRRQPSSQVPPRTGNDHECRSSTHSSPSRQHLRPSPFRPPSRPLFIIDPLVIVVSNLVFDCTTILSPVPSHHQYLLPPRPRTSHSYKSPPSRRFHHLSYRTSYLLLRRPLPTPLFPRHRRSSLSLRRRCSGFRPRKRRSSARLRDGPAASIVEAQPGSRSSWSWHPRTPRTLRIGRSS